MPTTGRILFRDDWTQANSTAWRAAWTSAATGGTVDVQSNAGRVARSGVTGAYAENAYALTTTPVLPSSWELRADVTVSSAATEQYDYLSVGNGVPQSGDVTKQAQMYAIGIFPGISKVSLVVSTSGTDTDLAADGSFTFANGDILHVVWRHDQAGWNFVKLWLNAVGGSTEPAAWKWVVQDGTYLGPTFGYIGLGLQGGNSITAHNLSIDNLVARELVNGRRRRQGLR